MHRNAELLTRFYSALQKHDAAAMAACYDRDVSFNDPAFRTLHGDRARAMWAMLCENGKDLKVEFSAVRADDANGSAHWEARYTFSATGKPVHNVIDATFEFRNGRITRHVDHFDFKTWAAQALGGAGRWFGGFKPFQDFFSRKANALLDRYIETKQRR